MSGHVRLRGDVWYAVISTRDEFGRRKTVWRSFPEAKGKREAMYLAADLRKQMMSGKFVAKKGTTLAQWSEHWLSIGAPGKKKRKIGRKSVERYGQILRCHVFPALGDTRLQDIKSTMIDRLYSELEGKGQIGSNTREKVHIILGSCLNAAVRAKQISENPVADVQIIPTHNRSEVDHGMVLTAEQMKNLLRQSRGHSLYAVIAFACLTGARRGETLALMWDDVDLTKKTITIRRALEQTLAGITFKGTKTGNEREIGISDDLVALLSSERERHLRIVAGVPDGAAVDLSLVKLPKGALVFPLLTRGEKPDLCRPRSPKAVSSMFWLLARECGYKGLRLHDLRGSHGTALLNAGEPVHSVAARLGHDPAMLLKAYAKTTDESKAKLLKSVAGMGLL
jgi:integrase